MSGQDLSPRNNKARMCKDHQLLLVLDSHQGEVAFALKIVTCTDTVTSSSESVRNGGDCVFSSTTTEKVPTPNPDCVHG